MERVDWQHRHLPQQLANFAKIQMKSTQKTMRMKRTIAIGNMIIALMISMTPHGVLERNGLRSVAEIPAVITSASLIQPIV